MTVELQSSRLEICGAGLSHISCYILEDGRETVAYLLDLLLRELTKSGALFHLRQLALSHIATRTVDFDSPSHFYYLQSRNYINEKG